jgi:nitroreductase
VDAYEAIAARKTIRDFDDREIGTDTVRRLLDAGLKAPSNNHLREWEFVVLKDRAKRKTLLERIMRPMNRADAVRIVNRWGMTDQVQRDMYIDAIPKQYSMLMNAGCLLLPCFRQRTPLLRPRNLSGLNAFASMWCCIENILVAAAAEGIFGVTRIPMEDERKTIKTALGIPDGYEVPCYVALGYPASGATRTEQTQVTVDEKVHVDAW